MVAPRPVWVATARDAGEMRSLAAALGAQLRAGDVVLLDGPLGAGKTTFVQGLAEGLGVRGPISSPTFVISRIHPSLRGGPALIHVDAYRIGPEEIDDLDLDTWLPDAVAVVEWGVGKAEHLADQHLLVRISRTTGAAGASAAGADDDEGAAERAGGAGGVGGAETDGSGEVRSAEVDGEAGEVRSAEAVREAGEVGDVRELDAFGFGARWAELEPS